jgi:phosphoglycolate phosphatase-like HAD superfamily hydrolase
MATAASRSLMLCDSVCDIEMARKINMYSCAVSWGATTLNNLLETSPDWAITEFTQLLDNLNARSAGSDFPRSR